MERLVFWDIDHTLVAMRGVGGELFGRAFARVTGRRMERIAAVDGMTDPVIFRETAALHGVSTGRREFEEFAMVLGEEHARAVAEIRSRGVALPGAASALAALAEAGVRQCVVTGNVRSSARVKLAAFGLDSFVDWEAGAYGEDAETRPELVRIALRRAGSPAVGQVSLLGDTPADVRAAAEVGVRAVGVATGRSGEEELAEAGADFTLSGLEDTEHVVGLALPR
ncbi:HAD family hydrolase [Streptomyces sp. NBRC 109706]|uniref:HAD family hydrolase n=1 Tax=Streptomyces sp. NBRC 109706 TaxID=1550035 RepID=UPI0007831EB6|nr:haloacid dehalogenase-like hydrolase [Streptomyces sp. NBRC 109706]